jgi:hypothetical protein
MLDNLRFLFFTNENAVTLGELAVKHFIKHNKKEGLNVSLVSNKFKDNNFQFKDKISYLSGDIEFQSNGGHFAQTLLKVLPQVEEEYIFFFCDDYFFIAETKYDDLGEVINMLKNDNIDYFCPDDLCNASSWWSNSLEKYTPNFDTKFKDNLYKRNNNHQYLFSVQPCIWKKESLLNLLKTYDNISLHDLDNTLPIIKENNKLKCVSSNLKSCFNHITFNKDDYFLIAYYELIRHGCFHIPENGYSINPEDEQVVFMKKLIDEEGLLYNPELKGKLFFYYDKMMGTTEFQNCLANDTSPELNFYVDPEWIKKFKKD